MTETTITETVRNGVDTATHVRDAGRDQGPARDRPVPLPGQQPLARRRAQPLDDQGLLRRLRRGHHPHRGLHPRRRRARDPARHRHRPEPGRVPAARAGRVRDHLAGVLGGRPQACADHGRVDARGRPRRAGRDGHEHRRLPQRIQRDPDDHPHRRRRPGREAARGRAARDRPVGRLRLDHATASRSPSTSSPPDRPTVPVAGPLSARPPAVQEGTDDERPPTSTTPSWSAPAAPAPPPRCCWPAPGCGCCCSTASTPAATRSPRTR